jgi:hypothetical protein
MSDSVLQAWVSAMPWKLQSILFSGLRGPDQELLHYTKQVSKWLRAVTQHNADPSKPYINGIKLPGSAPESRVAAAEMQAFWKELEHCPCHFVHHFLDALAIVAYFHPDPAVAEQAAAFHYDTAEEIFHFVPEPPHIFRLRHRDKRDGIDKPENQIAWDSHVRQSRCAFLRDAEITRRRTQLEPV